MPSVELLLGALAAAAIFVEALMVWRFCGVVDHLARSSQRFAERNDAARDRFMQSMLETMAVQGTPDAAVRLAQLHAQEARARHAAGLSHDHAVEQADSLPRRRVQRETERYQQESQPAVGASEQDAMA